MILQDESIGDSEPERKENIDKAKLEALGYNLFGFMMPFIAIVAQQSYVMVFIGIACPVGGLYILSRSQHIVKFFNEGDKSSYPAIGFGFMFLVASVLMAALIDNHVLNFLPILFPALLIAVVLFIFLYKNGLDRSVKNINTQIAAIAITSMAYGFGLNVLVNQVFDYSKPVMYQSSVIDAYITKGKGGTHYYFKIAAWPGQIENQSESVTRQQYLSLPLGTSVEVYQKKGLFHAPWYYVVLPETTPPAPAGSGNGNSPGPR
ncbi:hypothetical protein GWR56_20465 [Mucilaginibacter sp. 14171R-50]|uniref:hypothetical protein n=1 Tax=Mucilaginibacter sp. 14171R-50 TaxID=2703789 RepID=UPI00138BBCB7|nr:hypothetical protein [Mucilaginibacter sp. 14171R-50]QHS57804.1 hypothetical protein GWR56_20465 [Mucilaginibacter sp. 14171R-50]